MKEGSSWEAGRLLAGWEILDILNLEVYYHLHNRMPLIPTLKQADSVHVLPSYFFNIRFNIILFSSPRSSKQPFAIRLLNKKLCIYFCSLPWVPPDLPVSYLIWLWGVKIVKLMIEHFSPSSCHSLVFGSQYPHQHFVLEYHQPMFYFNMRDQLSRL